MSRRLCGPNFAPYKEIMFFQARCNSQSYRYTWEYPSILSVFHRQRPSQMDDATNWQFEITEHTDFVHNMHCISLRVHAAVVLMITCLELIGIQWLDISELPLLSQLWKAQGWSYTLHSQIWRLALEIPAWCSFIAWLQFWLNTVQLKRFYWFTTLWPLSWLIFLIFMTHSKTLESEL